MTQLHSLPLSHPVPCPLFLAGPAGLCNAPSGRVGVIFAEEKCICSWVLGTRAGAAFNYRSEIPLPIGIERRRIPKQAERACERKRDGLWLHFPSFLFSSRKGNELESCPAPPSTDGIIDLCDDLDAHTYTESQVCFRWCIPLLGWEENCGREGGGNRLCFLTRTVRMHYDSAVCKRIIMKCLIQLRLCGYVL